MPASISQRLKFGAALAVVAIAWPGVARAADGKTLGCVQQHLDPQGFALLDAYLDAMIQAPETGGEPEMTSATSQALGSAVTQCAKLHGWSESAAKSAFLYMIGVRGRSVMPKALAALGIDPVPVTRFYDRLPLTTRQTMPSEDPAREAGRDMYVQAIAQHIAPAGQGRRIGRYLGCLNMADAARADFVRN